MSNIDNISILHTRKITDSKISSLLYKSVIVYCEVQGLVLSYVTLVPKGRVRQFKFET